MKKPIIMMASVLLFMVLISSVSSVVHAQEEALSLEYSVFEMVDKQTSEKVYVRTTLEDYGIAYLSNAKGNPNLLWKYLKDPSIKSEFTWVGSTDKYVRLDDYGIKYLVTSKNNKDQGLGYKIAKIISESIKSTTAISEDIVSKYNEVIYIKDDKGNITGIESKPINPIDPEEFKVINIY